jgi:hypothetical protein
MALDLQIYMCGQTELPFTTDRCRLNTGLQIMEPTYNIAMETEPNASDMNVIVKGLAEFNRLQSGAATPEPLLITVRDGVVVGGLLGATY